MEATDKMLKDTGIDEIFLEKIGIIDTVKLLINCDKKNKNIKNLMFYIKKRNEIINKIGALEVRSTILYSRTNDWSSSNHGRDGTRDMSTYKLEKLGKSHQKNLGTSQDNIKASVENSLKNLKILDRWGRIYIK